MILFIRRSRYYQGYKRVLKLSIWFLIVFITTRCTSEQRYYAVQGRGEIAEGTVVLPVLNTTHTDSIKWTIYSLFFLDTVFHDNGFTTMGELKLDVGWTIKLSESTYTEESSNFGEDIVKKCVGCALLWTSRDSLIGIKKQSTFVTGVLYDTSSRQVLSFATKTMSITSTATTKTFPPSNERYHQLLNYLETNKNIDPWFRREAIRRGLLMSTAVDY